MPRSTSSFVHRAILVALVLVAVAVRLPGLGAPPLDVHHVRQADTASIARNMAREGVDPLRPRIDWAGPDAGTVESEFPLYNALVATTWLAADPDDAMPHASARALTILCWLGAGLALWAWLRRRMEGPHWPYLLGMGLSPLAVAFTRTIQPDALAVALLLVGLERADRAGDADEQATGWAVLAGLLVGFAAAVKGSVAFLLPLVPLLLFARGNRRPADHGAALGLALLIPAAWYAWAWAVLGADGASYGIWGSDAGKWGSFAVWFDPGTWRYIAGTFVTHTATPVGLVLVGGGLWAVRDERELRPFVAGLLCVGVSAVLVAQGFRLHNYYQLVAVPFLSVLAGAGGLALWRMQAPRRWSALVLVLVLAVPSAVWGVDFVARSLQRDERIEVTALALQVLVPAGRSVAVVDQHPQTLLYAMDRRGFHRTRISFGELIELEAAGADYLLLTETSPSFGDLGLLTQLQDGRPLSARGPDWLLFRLGRALMPPGERGQPDGDDDSADDDDSAPG